MVLQQTMYHNVSQNFFSIMQLFLMYLEREIGLSDCSSICVSVDAFYGIHWAFLENL